MKRIIACCLFLVVLLSVIRAFRKDDAWETRERYLLGTACAITLYARSPETRERAFQDAFNVITDIDRSMSVFSDSSELSVLNRTAFRSPVSVSGDLLYILQKSREIAILTDGAFDMTTLPLFKLWGFFSAEHSVPKKIDIEQARTCVDYRNIQIMPYDDSQRAWVSYMQEGMMIDLGGIAKGYACDRARRALECHEITDALINIGGTIYGMGRSKSGDLWRIGIRDPRDHSGLKKVITLVDRAVSTSGDYEQFFMRDGKRYAHIIDPRSGYPVEDTVAVTVIAPSGLMADGLSTGIFVLGADQGIALASRLADVEALIYTSENGEITEALSPRFADFVEISK